MQADVQSIDAVIVVADGLTPHLATATLNATTDIFPRTLVDNICLVFANSDEGDWKFETDSLPSELQNVRRCLLHNPLATLKVYRKVKKERSDDKQAAEELLDEVKTHYDLAVETLGSWLEWVDSRNTRSTNKLCEPFGLKSKVEKNIKAIPPGLARLEESESELKDIESDLEQAKDEANEIRKKLPPPIMKIPSFPIQPNPPPVSDSRDMERRMTEESLSKKEKEIARLETKRNSSREEVKKAKEAIETIQTDIRHIVDDFQKLYFSQNFTSGVNDAIQMLEHRKKGLESKAETEVERKIIDKIAEMLKEKLRAVGKQ
ncbi:hypothetical protein FRC07_009007 [Ceratobasidium sp. 392]|nr:hypothetical protein FRC07_009007 [Ceratobasidium sp. 392]